MPPRKTRKQAKRANDPQERLRQEKIECLVQEAENAFEQYKKDMWDAYVAAKLKTQKDFDFYLRSLPDWLKKMTIKEAMEKNVDFKSIVFDKKERVDTKSILSKFMNKNNAKLMSATKKSATKALTAKENIPLSKRKASGNKRKSIVAKKIRASSTRRSRLPASQLRKRKTVDLSADNSYVDVSEDEVFYTPSHQSHRKLDVITPKFDASKPVLRSQLRRARPGELAVSLSGSPLLYESEKQHVPPTRTHSETVKVSLGKKVYHFSESDTQKKRSITERRQLLELRKKLDLMLKK